MVNIDMDRIGNRSLPMVLDEQAAQYADRTFLVHEDLEGTVTRLSFAELRAQSHAYAAALQGAGLGKGDRAFMFLRNTADFVPLWFGIMAAGGVAAPGNVYLTATEVEYLVSHVDPAVIVTERKFLTLLAEVMERSGSRATLISADGGEGAVALADRCDSAPAFNPPAIESDDLAQILFTSGTSSHPKGVMQTHANLVWCGIAGVANTALTPQDRSFNNKPLFHANCQETVLACLTGGATAIIGERYSASRYIGQLIAHEATICSLSGMLCRTLINQPPSDQDRAHKIRFAGYGINISEAEIAAFIERFGIRLRNGYGASEAMLYVTVESVSSPSTYPSIGRPALEREVFIVDEENRILPQGEIGEIVVRGTPGRNLMLGYYRDEEATRAVFEGGWLHTKDLGWFDETGNLHFADRRGDMIKRAGENISAREVEDALLQHEAIRDAAVIGVPDPVRDEAVKAFVVRRDGQQVSAGDLSDFCAGRLAYFKLPEFIVFVDELPRNASGKIQKRALEDLPEARAAHPLETSS